MKSVKLNIVGMRYKNVGIGIIDALDCERITFVPEPENRNDPNAIKCISDGFHFGYVDRANAIILGRVLVGHTVTSISKNWSDPNKIKITVYFKPIEKANSPTYSDPLIDIGHTAGIYQIKFNSSSDDYFYYGQSIDARKRCQEHVRNLNQGTHQNVTLQSGWDTNPSSFQFKVVEVCPSDLTGLDRQIFLFKREMHWISNCAGYSANRIKGDLVLTIDALSDIKSLRETITTVINELKACRAYQKEKLGEVFINLGIIYGEKVRSTNVLTWLNKTRYGMLEIQPKIDESHMLFNDLHNALTLLNNQVKELEADKRFIAAFPKITPALSEYDTIDPKNVETYLGILETYKKYGSIRFANVKKGKTTGFAINFDRSLETTLSKSTISVLKKGLPIRSEPADQSQLQNSRKKKPWWNVF
tara:strand:+ start:22116 stop:23366 length:1251 start_codon:yes stop_codon:yes gene_type:complete